ncbi:MAG: MBL fold metallo-hydrolase [Planctomycetota bacterium]|nr:MAG: MBL fold metallo-hydrolase [Planctomycetota bacterium]
MSRLVTHQVGNLRIEGFSLAGEETVLIVPELNVCFDPGRAPREIIAIDNVCLTHGHMDHAAGIAYYLSQRNFVGIAPGRVIVHRDLAQPIQRLMAVWVDIEGHPTPGEVVGVQPLEDVPLRRDLVVRPFSVNHDRCSLGFSVIERRHKLKAAYSGKTGPELVELKRQGVTIDEWREITLVTCSGDTALGRWLEHAFVRYTEVLLVECTFIDEDHVDRARGGRHIHVRDLPKILDAVPDARVVLTHLSRRTDLRRAKEVVQRFVGKSAMERILFLMDRPPKGRPQPRDGAASREAHLSR